MHEEPYNEENIVRMVYTYTPVSHLEKSHQKPRKRGITRITQGQSSSKDKIGVIRHFQEFPGNEENYDHSNSQQLYRHQDVLDQQPTQQELVSRIRDLENELLLLEKEKLEMQRQQRKIKDQPDLIESQYITCNEDIEGWLSQKQACLNRIAGLQVENNFLKMNMGIQEQFINKLQHEAQQLRGSQKILTQKEVQTDKNLDFHFQFDQIIEGQREVIEKIEQRDNCTQCILEVPLGSWEELQVYSEQMDRQTHELRVIIEQLQSQKRSLGHQNKELIIRIARMEELQDKCFIQSQLKSRETEKIMNIEIDIRNQLVSHQDQVQRLKELLVAKELEITSNMMSFQESTERLQGQLAAQKNMLNRGSVEQMNQNHYLVTKVDQLQAKNDQLYTRKDELQSINSQLQSKNGRLQVKNSQLQSENGQLQSMRSQMQYKSNQLQSKNDQLEVRNSQLQFQNGQLLSSNVQLQSAYSQLKANSEQLQSNNHQLKARNVQLQSRNVQLQSRKDQVQSSTTQLQYKNEQLQSTVDRFVAKNNQLQVTIGQLSEQIHQLKTSIDKLQAKNKDFYQQNRLLTMEIQESARELSRQQEIITIYEEEIHKKTELIGLYERELDDKGAKIASQDEDSLRLRTYQPQLRKKEDKVTDLRLQMSELSLRYEEKARQWSQLKQENVSLLRQLHEGQSNQEHSQNELTLLTRQYSSQIDEIEHSMRQLQHSLEQEMSKNRAAEQGYISRLELVKRDYDVLYNKYLKYKNMAIVLQNKNPHLQFS